ncbi:hypothetical protein BC829DRAFT_395070 [Chytridium lagenaria]|nr:hypothetical protein BC829DRAFT_395070 [Chytridium lagenaria]
MHRVVQIAHHFKSAASDNDIKPNLTSGSTEQDLFNLTVDNGDGFYYKRIADDLFQPTNLTIGPWSPSSQHGGPVSALLTYAFLEHVAKEQAGFGIHKLSIHLYRPRGGLLLKHQDLQSVEEFKKGGDICDADDNPPLPPQNVLDKPMKPKGGPRQTYRNTLDWVMRPRVDVITSESYKGSVVWTRPARGMALIVDKRTGERVPSRLIFTYSNVDYNVVWRGVAAKESGWMCMKSVSRVTTKSTGVCESQLFDENGKIASTSQNLIVKAIKS